MSTGAYLVGLLLIAAALAGATLTGRSVRRMVAPGLSGPPAALATAVLSIAAVTLISELLGVAGILTAATLLGGLGVAALVAVHLAGDATPARARRGRSKEGSEWFGASRSTKMVTALSFALALAVVAQWAVPSLVALDRGIYGGDSLWYHLPFAAHIAQTGSVTELLYTDTLYLNWFYPQVSELLGADALLLFGNDYWAPLANLGWLALALLAGWTAGAGRGYGAPAMAAVAALMASNLMFSRQAGGANNDVVVVALMLAGVAILLQIQLSASGARVLTARPAGVLAIAGIAAGLALGTKLTAAVPVAVLTAGVIAVAPAALRARAALVWAGALLAGGGYWFARNLIVSGTPLPWVSIGPLDKVAELAGRDPHSIVHYATDTGVWGRWFVPGLEERLGDLWPVVLALALAGAAIALTRGDRTERMLGGLVAVAAIGYLLTPLGAAGEEGSPSGFRLNIRYLAPALAIALVLAARPPAAIITRAPWWRAGATAVFALLALVSFAVLDPLDGDRIAGTLLLCALVAAPVAVVALRGSVPPPALVAAAGCLLALGAVAGKGSVDDYLQHRYALDAPGYPADEHPSTELGLGLGSAFQWARGISDERIGLSGELGPLFQYGLWGRDADNAVRVIGQKHSRGGFGPSGSCAAFVAAVNAGRFDYLVTTPAYEQDNPAGSVAPRERRYLRAAARTGDARRVGGASLVDVWKLRGALPATVCGGQRR